MFVFNYMLIASFYCTPPAHAMFTIVPGAPPSNIKVTATSSNSLEITWKPPSEDKRHGVITYYKIRYSRVSKGKLGQKHEFTASAAKRSYIIDNLQSWTEYKVWILAGTAIGDGPPSKPILARTFEHGR